jgi:simple sugar transport system permease protein
VITRGPAVAGFPDPFLALGNSTFAGIPAPLWLFSGAAVVVALLLGRTVHGVQAGLVGTSEKAARFAGIPVDRVLVRTYVVCGLLAGVAGLLMIARTNSAKADYGTSYLLQAVLVAVLGGVDPRGGFGRVRGVVLALLSLQFLSSGFSLLRFSQFTKEFAWGALLLIVMAAGACSRRSSSTRS